jgi:hypothetical protein
MDGSNVQKRSNNNKINFNKKEQFLIAVAAEISGFLPIYRLVYDSGLSLISGSHYYILAVLILCAFENLISSPPLDPTDDSQISSSITSGIKEILLFEQRGQE